MAEIEHGRMTTEASEGFTLFLIGMRVNDWRRVRAWWWVTRSFNEMLGELRAERGRGLLASRSLVDGRGVTSVQYWESTEKLMAYAHDSLHKGAWRDFYRHVDDGAVGIWHETYHLGRQEASHGPGHEAFYTHMPVFGLGEALGTRPVTRANRSAADRLRRAGTGG
ncbi:DUF4188 domain-containing protein [Marinactinospora thermotolerans]|uniref:DUF4188 domain-containing protein n=1 Tax=Marinactinospora thermotolerans DSM 45154 TaxID=1122192 RepID=A0A1T4SEY3_9ACTN|nr:DUF4188 domain-containing protein [Marinactinospora thermotolerans]SKA26854.1 protein of unknown function [Marinactinospora thermotolerans DSM 45154]